MIVMTVDEIIASLKNSTLPTVFVEGRDDMTVYRQIEKLFGTRKCNFLACGGRKTLLKVFERRNELPPNIPSLFIADKDMWVVESVPNIYSDIYFTHGYSIENDLYIDGKHILDGLLDENELIIKQETINSLIEWFSHEVDLYLSGKISDNKFSEITILNEGIMPINKNCFSEKFLLDRNFQKPRQLIHEQIRNDYSAKLRGKFIFQTYRRLFEHFRKKNNRYAIVFSDYQLFELCYREGIKPENSNSNMNRLIATIKQKFNIINI